MQKLKQQKIMHTHTSSISFVEFLQTKNQLIQTVIRSHLGLITNNNNKKSSFFIILDRIEINKLWGWEIRKLKQKNKEEKKKQECLILLTEEAETSKRRSRAKKSFYFYFFFFFFLDYFGPEKRQGENETKVTKPTLQTFTVSNPKAMPLSPSIRTTVLTFKDNNYDNNYDKISLTCVMVDIKRGGEVK